MSRQKDTTAHSPRTREQYARTLVRAFGRTRDGALRIPTYVPEHQKWPESTRSILRAAIKAYWAERDTPEKGIALALKIKHGPVVKRAKVWPTVDEGERFEREAARVEPRAAFLITKLCLRLGLRSEEMLSTSRAKWQAAQRWGRLSILGKGNVERVLQVTQLRKTIEELLGLEAKQPHAHDDAVAGAPWSVPGELLSKPGSKLGTQRNLLDRYLKKVAESAGLDPKQWHPHTLRHVFTDRLLADGGNVREAQLALGHARLETLERYTHPTPESIGRKLRGD